LRAKKEKTDLTSIIAEQALLEVIATPSRPAPITYIGQEP
jgi:hypothetical protein